MLVVDDDAVVASATEPVEQVFGYAPTELVDSPVRAVVADPAIAPLASEDPPAGATRTRCRHASGTVFTTRLALAPLASASHVAVTVDGAFVARREWYDAALRAAARSRLAGPETGPSGGDAHPTTPAVPATDGSSAPDRGRPPRGDATPRDDESARDGESGRDDELARSVRALARRNAELRERVETIGRAALERLDDAVDVLLVDRRMPGISGDELVRTVRERGHDCAIAMVSAIDPDLDVVSTAFDAYLVKPLSGECLRQLVEELTTIRERDEAVRDQYALLQQLATPKASGSRQELWTNETYAELLEELSCRRAAAPTDIESLVESTFESVLADLRTTQSPQ